LSRAQDVLLPDEVLEPLRAHSLRQRPLGIVRHRPPRIDGCGVEQTHVRSILWRRASYNRIPAAIAAFSDSTPTVGIDKSSDADRSSVLTPCASLPMTNALRTVRSTKLSARAGALAFAGTPENAETLFC